MYPVLFKIPYIDLAVHTYGFFVAMGYLVAVLWIKRESRLRGLNPAESLDLGFYVIIAAIIGGRLFHVLISERERLIADPLYFFRIWEGGLVYYGGLIGSLIVGIWYIRRHKMSFWRYGDVFAPAISIGHSIGRMGCFMAGCCYGRPVGDETWYSIIFPSDPNTFAPIGIPLYPTQLMEVIGELIIFCVLLFFRGRKKFDGQLFATYLVAYSILRSFTEYFRGDYVRGFLIEPWISTSQFVSIVLFVIGTVIFIRRWNIERV